MLRNVMIYTKNKQQKKKKTKKPPKTKTKPKKKRQGQPVRPYSLTRVFPVHILTVSSIYKRVTKAVINSDRNLPCPHIPNDFFFPLVRQQFVFRLDVDKLSVTVCKKKL